MKEQMIIGTMNCCLASPVRYNIAQMKIDKSIVWLNLILLKYNFEKFQT